MNSFSFFSDESLLFEQKAINKQIITSLQISSLLKDSKDISNLLCLNRIISTIPFFDDICQQYFSLLIEFYKDEMNNNKRKNIICINALITQFIKVFHNNYQVNNNKHKSVLKQLSIFVNVYLKLFQNVINELLNFGIVRQIESFCIMILQGINYYPKLFRPFQAVIEEILKKVFMFYIINLNNNYADLNIQIIYTTYSILFKLASANEQKFNQTLELIMTNIKITYDYFKSREITQKIQKETNKELLIIDVFAFEQTNISLAIRSLDLLFTLLKEHFKLISPNEIMKIQYQNLLSFYYDNLLLLENNDICSYSIQGLSKNNYQQYLDTLYLLTLDHITFHLRTNSEYLLSNYFLLNKVFNKVIINDASLKSGRILKLIITLYITIVQSYTIITFFPDIIDQILFRFTFNIFPLMYLDFLEKNDKTIVKIDNTLFKLGNKKGKMSLIEKNHITDQSHLIANYTKEENKEIILLFFQLLKSYFVCNHYSQINNSKSLLVILIDLIVIPPHSKFIFNLSYNVKKAILELVEEVINHSAFEDIICKDKISQFYLKFYHYGDSSKRYKLNQIQNQLKDYTDKNKETVLSTELFIDFNTKIAQQLLKKSDKFIEQINNYYDNNIYCLAETQINIEKDDDYGFLHKKRDKETNSNLKDINVSPRKGLTVKFEKTINQPYTSKTVYKSDDKVVLMTSQDIIMKEQNQHQKSLEETLFDDDIKVPDLI